MGVDVITSYSIHYTKLYEIYLIVKVYLLQFEWQGEVAPYAVGEVVFNACHDTR